MSETITLNINGTEVEGRTGETILQVAERSGIYIPTLCAQPDLTPFGACRLCIVEVERMKDLPPSCTTPAQDGMVVRTNTPQLTRLRLNILDFMLSEHPHECLTCHRRERCSLDDICLRQVDIDDRCVICALNGRCDLQKVADYVGMTEVSLPYTSRGMPVEDSEPFFDRDYNLCILCGRCVRVCQEVRGVGAVAFTHRGSQVVIGTAFGRSLADSGCKFCGACVDSCPVGALVERENKWAGVAERTVLTTCPYCGVGCALDLEIKGDRIMRVVPAQGAANHGQACVKGKFGLGFVHSSDRLRTPLIKREGLLVEASWDEALSLVTERLSAAKGDSFAAVASAKCSNEDNYVLQKFARVVMGTNNIDHCARLCQVPTIVGLGEALGVGAMTNPIDDVRQASCILVVGANATEAHPVIGAVVRRAGREGAKLIVADPRWTDLSQFADVWLRQKPGTDIALLLGMIRVIIDEGLYNKEFVANNTEGFETIQASVAEWDLRRAAETTGLDVDAIQDAARSYAAGPASLIVYSAGVMQHTQGLEAVRALANLALLTGNIGRAGAGIMALAGQNNVQGACDVGCLPDFFPGFQPVNEANAAKFGEDWVVKVSAKAGRPLAEMLGGLAKGEIKALYLMGENPVLSDPDAEHVKEALEKAEFLVVQDIFLTETAELADVVLPGASFAEKDGSFTNTERRIQLVRRAVPAPGQAKPDWWITCEIARRMGARGFDYQDAAGVMAELAQVSAIYGGISHARLEEGSLQWPCPSAEHAGTPRLHEERIARGKGRFFPVAYVPPPEMPDEDYPMVLITGRGLFRYDTDTMTGKVAGLRALGGGDMLEVNPGDAEVIGVGEGEALRIISRHGSLTARVHVTDDSPPGAVYLTVHSREVPANLVTGTAPEPGSLPHLKRTAVRLEKVAAG